MNIPPSTSNGVGPSALASRPAVRARADLDDRDDLTPPPPLSPPVSPPQPPPPAFSQAQMTSNLFHLMDTFGPTDDDFFSTDPDHLSSSDNDLHNDFDQQQPGRGLDMSAAYYSGSPADAFDSTSLHVNLEDNQYLHQQLELSRAERELRELEQAAFTNLPNFLPGVFPGRVGAEKVSPERLKRYGVPVPPNDASVTDNARRANNAGPAWAAAAGVDADDETGHEGGTSEDQTSPTPAILARQQQRAATAPYQHHQHRHTASTSSLFSTPNQSNDSHNAAPSMSPPRAPAPLVPRTFAHSPTNSGNVSDDESSPSSGSTIRSTASGRIMLSPAARVSSPQRPEPAPIKKAGKQVTRLDSAMVDEDASLPPTTSRLAAVASAAIAQAEVGLGPEVQHHYLSSMVPTSRDMSPMPSLPPSATSDHHVEVAGGAETRVMAFSGTSHQQHGADSTLSAFAHYLAHHPHLHPLPIPTPQAVPTTPISSSSTHASHESVSANTGFHLSPMVLPFAAPTVRPTVPAPPAPLNQSRSPLAHKQPIAARSRAPAPLPISPPTRSRRQVALSTRTRASPERAERPANTPSISHPSSVMSRASASSAPARHLPVTPPPTTSISQSVLSTATRVLPLNVWFPAGTISLRPLHARLSRLSTATPLPPALSDLLHPTPAAVLALLVYMSATWTALAFPTIHASLTTNLTDSLRGPRAFQALVLPRLVRVVDTLILRPVVWVLSWIAAVACVGSVGAIRATAAGAKRAKSRQVVERSGVGVLVGMSAAHAEAEAGERNKRTIGGMSRKPRTRPGGSMHDVTVVEALAAVYRARHAWVAQAELEAKQEVGVPALVVLVAEVMVVYLAAAAGWLERNGAHHAGSDREEVTGDSDLGRGVWVVDVGLLADRVGGGRAAALQEA